MILLAAAALSACGTFGTSSNHSTSKIPKVPVVQVPGGRGDNWHYLGTTENGKLIIEVNEQSIKRTQDKTYKFQERKTVANPAEFSYVEGQVHYKYLMSNWLMNCNTKQYLLQDITIYNELGAAVKKLDYSSNGDVRWLRFGSGTIAELEYNYVCLNINRNLGY